MNKMKDIIFFVFLFGLTCGKVLEHPYHYEEPVYKREREFLKADAECQSDPATAADNEERGKLRSGIDVDSPGIHKFVFCICKKVNIVKDNGELNKEVTTQDLQLFNYDQTEIKEIVNECSVTPDEDLVESRVYKVFKCLRKYWNPEENYKKEFAKINEACGLSSKVDRNAFGKLFNGEKIVDPKLDQFVFCLSEKLGIQDKEGNINKEAIRKHAKIYVRNPETITNIANECGVNTGTKSAEATVKVLVCMENKIHRAMNDEDRERHTKNVPK